MAVDRRFLLFVTLSFLLLTANALWNARNLPPQPAGPQAAAPADAVGGKAGEAGADGAADADAKADGAEADAVADAVDGGTDSSAIDQAGAAAEPKSDFAAEFVTLGSVDAGSSYRMLVTLTNEGAAMRRVELSSPRFLDLHDRGGYIGHLELSTAGGEGLLVQAVGAGTPAAEAGLRVGDRIVGAGRTKTTPVEIPEEFVGLLAKLKPEGDLLLDVIRDGAKTTLTAKLRRRPLEVIRPESNNVRLRGAGLPPDFVEPPSFLLTLSQDGTRDDRRGRR